MLYPRVPVVAKRLHSLWTESNLLGTIKGVQIDKEQFNTLASRRRITTVFLNSLQKALGKNKNKLKLVRFGHTFAILDAGTVEDWVKVSSRTVTKLCRDLPSNPGPKVLTVKSGSHAKPSISNKRARTALTGKA